MCFPLPGISQSLRSVGKKLYLSHCKTIAAYEIKFHFWFKKVLLMYKKRLSRTDQKQDFCMLKHTNLKMLKCKKHSISKSTNFIHVKYPYQRKTMVEIGFTQNSQAARRCCNCTPHFITLPDKIKLHSCS